MDIASLKEKPEVKRGVNAELTHSLATFIANLRPEAIPLSVRMVLEQGEDPSGRHGGSDHTGARGAGAK